MGVGRVFQEGRAMSRSGYSDDIDGWALIRWRGAVTSAIRGERGQAMLRELVQALDALPEKRLASGSLVTAEGDYCTLGALGRARGMDMAPIDPEDREAVAKAFGVAEALAAEITAHYAGTDKLVVVGSSTDGSGANKNFSLMRLNEDGSRDNTFVGSSAHTMNIADYTEGAAAVVLDNAVQIQDAQLGALNGGNGNYSGAYIFLGRQGGARSQDVLGISTSGASFTISGSDDWTGGLLRDAGLNVIDGEKKDAVVSVEGLAAINPDAVIVLAAGTSTPTRARAEWNAGAITSRLRASQAGQVYFFDYHLFRRIRGLIAAQLVERELVRALR
jgi:hypothetical protein